MRMLALSGIALAYQGRVRRHGPLTRIVVFHDVPDRVWFKALISELTKTTNLLTPETFAHGVRDESRLNLLITFDDGYASWVEVALPVLREFGIKALFFVNSGLLDAAPSSHESEHFMREQLRIRPRAPLTWEGAAALVREGHTSGGHAHMHEDFDRHSL
jgi:peptidoglycan/xylan/chitin deacetylase (PgdA/CDA1 family)